MNKDTFIDLMNQAEWEYIGKPNVANMAGITSDGSEINWQAYASQNQFLRGNCVASITDQEIDDLDEKKYKIWFSEYVECYYFKDDWKKAFVGSEFLIPIVEHEFKMRERWTKDDFSIQLLDLKSGKTTVDELIEKISKEVLTKITKNENSDN